LVLEGSVPQGKKENLEKFNATLKGEILKGIDPKTTVSEIECNLSAGTPYIEIKNVVDCKTNLPVDLKHKPG
jgi:hypothetical protein